MKKIVTWVTAGLFALSLQGGAWAQKEEKVPEAGPPPVESTTPAAPGEQAVTPEKPQKTSKKSATQKSKKKTTKKKTTKRAKKKSVNT